MAEETVKKSGRPKKVTNEDNMAQMLEQLQKQMAQMQKELEETKKEKEEATSQNLDLQVLIEALKNGNGNNANLPNYVTVVSLVPNIYNLSTEEKGRGNCYSFSDIGDTKIISLNNMQSIMGISKYRKQAEDGFFYILEDEVNEYFRINITSNDVDNIKAVMELSSDDSVDKFVSLDSSLQIALADRMALDIKNGKKLDRNKLGEILDKTGIDIEEKAKNLKKIMSKKEEQ